MWANGEPIDPSPSIDQAINGGYPWLETQCSRCKTRCDVDLAGLLPAEPMRQLGLRRLLWNELDIPDDLRDLPRQPRVVEPQRENDRPLACGAGAGQASQRFAISLLSQSPATISRDPLTQIKRQPAPMQPVCSGARFQELAMTKTTAIAALVLLMTTSPLVRAAETSQTAGTQAPSAADLKSLTDMRVGIIKAALQLTTDQEKYWPAVEDAIRNRATNRQARLQRIVELHDEAVDPLKDSNPVELMQRRAERLIQRGDDLKKLAAAWEPLYKTLSEDQKRRMSFASYVVMRGMRDVIQHSLEPEDEDE